MRLPREQQGIFVMSERTVLVVDDEFAIRDMLRMALEIVDFRCLEADNIQDAHALIVDQRPDIVLLDWMLPGGSGIELLRRLKRDDATSEIAGDHAHGQDHGRQRDPGAGRRRGRLHHQALRTAELIARIRALLRRTGGGENADRMQVSELVLDAKSRRVFLGEQPLDMGPTEFNLLRFFMSHPERAYSRNQLLDQVWGANVYVEERTVDVHIRRLRKALQRESVTTAASSRPCAVRVTASPREGFRDRVNLAGSWRAELRKLLLVLAASAVLGYFSGYTLEMLSLGLAGVAGSWLFQLWRMRRWLEDPDQAPPEGSGIWGLIYDTIYGLQRENREARGRLQSTVDYLRSSFASMRDGVVILTQSGAIEWCNDAAGTLLGLQYPRDRGQPVLNLLRWPAFHDYFLAGEFPDPAADCPGLRTPSRFCRSRSRPSPVVTS
jgi:two-component system phosphate regulon response regulator PhoB